MPDPNAKPGIGNTPAAGPGRFVWPPVKARPAQPGQAAGGVELKLLPSRGQLIPGTSIDVDLAQPAAPTSWQRAIDQFEDHWLGLTHPPLRRVMAETGWRPDVRGACCPRCGQTVAAIVSHGAGVEGGCETCREEPRPWTRLVRLGEYRGELAAMIRQVKFTHWRQRGGELGSLLGASVRDELNRAGVDPALAPIVPVPMSFMHRILRGIDHSRVIARAVARGAGSPLAPVLARRRKPPQSSLPASERARNMSRVMRPVSGLHIPLPGLDPWQRLRMAAERGVPMVLVDDVTTTGATLWEALRDGCKAREIKSLECWIAVVAVTPRAENQPR
ncbi:MAG: ComF family protein [Phycisphaerales bacterium]